MGLSSILKLLSCKRRQPEPAPKAQAFCPISGKTSTSGVCPISGHSSTSFDTGATAAAKAATLKQRGNELFRNKDFEEALVVYGDAIVQSPKDATLWLNRAICNRQLSNWKEAADDSRIALELDEKNSKAFYSLALSLRHLHEVKEALEACERGLACDPENKALLQLQRDIRANKPLPEEVKKGQEAKLSSAEKEQEDVSNAETDTTEAPSEAPKCPASQLAGGELQEAKEKAQEVAYEWKNREPTRMERKRFKKMMVDMFLQKYRELKTASASHKAKVQTDQYEPEQKMGLQIAGGHRPMPRPDNIDVPKSFRKWIGELSPEGMAKYGSSNPERRYLLSVYGDIFDVSDRPDKYGPEGPYALLTGMDITWGLFTGIDTVDFCNKFYDLYKAKDLGKDKLTGICSWLAWYQTEYGEPVGKLTPWVMEEELPAPPAEELGDNCVVM